MKHPKDFKEATRTLLIALTVGVDEWNESILDPFSTVWNPNQLSRRTNRILCKFQQFLRLVGFTENANWRIMEKVERVIVGVRDFFGIKPGAAA